MEKEKKHQCADCGELLLPTERVCPSCGSSRRRVFVVARDTVQALSEIIGETENQLGKIKEGSATGTKRSLAKRDS